MCLCLGGQHWRVGVPTYVDDCHINGKTKDSIQHIKVELQKRFKLRDLAPTSSFLGINIQSNRSARLITHSQCQFIIDMPKNFVLKDWSPVKIPMVSHLLTPEEIELIKDKFASSACHWLMAPDLTLPIPQVYLLAPTTAQGRPSGCS